MSGEEKVAYDLFVEETRKMLGNPAKLPNNFMPRTAKQIKEELYSNLAKK